MRTTKKIMMASLTLIFLFTSCSKEDSEEPNNIDNDTSFTDPRDGQTYNIVDIGNQTWFAENLNYDINIQAAPSDVDWNVIFIDDVRKEEPAWCYYDNDASYGDTFGKLYNWYAINSGELCPAGWHVPSDTEWEILQSNLGGPLLAGGEMKVDFLWNSPNTGANNASGFSALPSGYRNASGFNGDFDPFGDLASFWSSTLSDFSFEYSVNLGQVYFFPYSFTLSHDSTRFVKEENTPEIGMSCRCLKD